MRILYIIKNFPSFSQQNDNEKHPAIFFSEPGGVGQGGTNWPTEIVEIAKHYEFDLSPVTHIWVTLSDFFLHISL